MVNKNSCVSAVLKILDKMKKSHIDHIEKLLKDWSRFFPWTLKSNSNDRQRQALLHNAVTDF